MILELKLKLMTSQPYISVKRKALRRHLSFIPLSPLLPCFQDIFGNLNDAMLSRASTADTLAAVDIKVYSSTLLTESNPVLLTDKVMYREWR